MARSMVPHQCYYHRMSVLIHLQYHWILDNEKCAPFSLNNSYCSYSIFTTPYSNGSKAVRIEDGKNQCRDTKI